MSANGPAPLPRAPVPSGSADNATSQGLPSGPTSRRWYQYLGPSIFALFCIELGILLVLAPWIDVYERNVHHFIPQSWQAILLSHQFRGALSALGFLNFLIAFSELIDLVRPSAGKP